MAENQNMTQVTWIYTDISEYSTVLSATTDATTGISSLNVTNDKSGHTRTYTTVMLNPGDYMLEMYVLDTNFLYKKRYLIHYLH